MFVLDYHVCYGWTFPGTTALGLVPPQEILVSLLSQCQSHWLTWILSLLCSTASSWYMPTNIHYVLHQLMFLLQVIVCILYPARKTKGAGETVQNVLTCHSGGVKNYVPLTLWWSVKTSAVLQVWVCNSFYSFVVWGIWLYCKLLKQVTPVWILA